MRNSFRSTSVLTDRMNITDIPEITDLLLASKKVRLTIEGFSMYPTLRTGDWVDIDPALKQTLKAGDLIVFRKEKQLVCHRLVEIFEKDGNTWVKTKGDTVKGGDPLIGVHQVLGRVNRIERNGHSWSPDSFPQKPSLKDSLVFFLKKYLENKPKVFLKNLLLSFQSYAFFRVLLRLFYRLWIRPKVIFLIGIPTSQTADPKFWHYLPKFSIPEPHEDLLQKSSYRFFAKLGKEVIGSLEMNASLEEGRRSEWFVSHLFVKTKWRGCGVATTLLQWAIPILRRQGVPSLAVCVTPQNHPALSFFRKLGFQGVLQKESLLFRKEISFPIQLLDREGELEPFLYYFSSTGSLETLSLDRMETLRKSFIKNVARQLLFEQVLFEIKDAFEKAGVPFLVQKGMAVAYTLYPDPATRPMVDIDLYLRKKDIPTAMQCLRDRGYRMDGADFCEEMLRFGGEFCFYRENASAIELHWGLQQYERFKGIVAIEEQELWEKAVSYFISGRKFLTFSPEHQLIALAIHLGLNHRFQGALKWFLDIDRLVLTYGDTLHWEEVFETAKKWGVAKILCQTLLATQKLFDTPLPPLPIQKRSFLLKRVSLQWLLLDRPLDCFRVLFRIFFPSREWLVYRYRLRERKRVHFYRLLHPLFVFSGKTR